MNLAQHLAQSMADGHVDRLPRLTRHADPAFAQDLLLAYYRLRDEAQRQRAEEGAEWSVSERVAVSLVVSEIESAIADTRAWLSHVARRGGRGVLPPGCRGVTPAVRGHGCPASAVAVGPANVAFPALHNLSRMPLFAARGLQELPWNQNQDVIPSLLEQTHE